VLRALRAFEWKPGFTPACVVRFLPNLAIGMMIERSVPYHFKYVTFSGPINSLDDRAIANFTENTPPRLIVLFSFVELKQLNLAELALRCA